MFLNFQNQSNLNKNKKYLNEELNAFFSKTLICNPENQDFENSAQSQSHFTSKTVP